MSPKQKNKPAPKTCENIQHSVATVVNIRDYLTVEEECQIHLQFRSRSWKPDSQVLWSGMLREEAQKWADQRSMQTLTTAMGPLMDENNPLCPRKRKSLKSWSKYIHGASVVFAWHIARGNKVTMLCPPPPERFHPSGKSFYQMLEEPIIRQVSAQRAKHFVIQLVHPAVRGAEDYSYEFWPQDEETKWVSLYGSGLCYKCRWRFVKGGSISASTTKGPAQRLPLKSKPVKVENLHPVLTASAISSSKPNESTGDPKVSIKKVKAKNSNEEEAKKGSTKGKGSESITPNPRHASSIAVSLIPTCSTVTAISKPQKEVRTSSQKAEIVYSGKTSKGLRRQKRELKKLGYVAFLERLAEHDLTMPGVSWAICEHRICHI